MLRRLRSHFLKLPPRKAPWEIQATGTAPWPPERSWRRTGGSRGSPLAEENPVPDCNPAHLELGFRIYGNTAGQTPQGPSPNRLALATLHRHQPGEDIKANGANDSHSWGQARFDGPACCGETKTASDRSRGHQNRQMKAGFLIAPQISRPARLLQAQKPAEDPPSEAKVFHF